MKSRLDQLVAEALGQFAADPHICSWWAKENDWVNYFVHKHLMAYCDAEGVLRDPAQIGIEVAVPQPPGYDKPGVRRDVVIWQQAGETCWSGDWSATRHPLAIIEWKVHRPHRRNRDGAKERSWLRRYCRWMPSVRGYAVEVDCSREFPVLDCTRFHGRTEIARWFFHECK